MRQHAAAVTVVTAPGSPPVGFTATSFTSVSLDPPMVSFCLARSASAWPTVMVAETIAVHVLGQEHEAAARAFATHGIDRFSAHGAWHAGPNGVPLLDGFLIRLTCRVVTRVDAGDHTIVLASPEVGERGTGEATAPLVYHAGTYVGLGRIEPPQVW